MFSRMICYAVNSLCCRMYRADYKRFRRLTDVRTNEKVKRQVVRDIQEHKLLSTLRSNQKTEFGRRYNFSDLSSAKQYQDKVPLSEYEDYSDGIARISRGEPGVLTRERVLLLEPSSGSASPSKLIPYTQSLKREFQAGIRPWIHDLYTSVPRIKWGQSYWSITPPTTKTALVESAVSIGFDDDKSYFGSIENLLLDLVFAVPSEVSKTPTISEFYHRTALKLLTCKHLTLISVWNPSFLLLLLQFIEDNIDALSTEISKWDRQRAKDIRIIVAAQQYARLWKDLKMISCWANVSAHPYAQRLRQMFPAVRIQPKGLIATEGFVSFPLSGFDSPVLSVYSHFFEFASVKNGQICLASELEEGIEYEVILTTSGGLYRYQLKDIVRVTGFAGAIPMVEFVGKQDIVSDLFGEKLNEQFVRNVTEVVSGHADFVMLAPEGEKYVLYVRFGDAQQTNESAAGAALAQRLDLALRANFHYDHCRNLGQLKSPRVFLLSGTPQREYLEECVRRGQRLGNIKPAALHRQGGWDKVFMGAYL